MTQINVQLLHENFVCGLCVAKQAVIKQTERSKEHSSVVSPATTPARLRHCQRSAFVHGAIASQG